MNTIPRPEYPRPQMVRKDWINLNGKWQFEIDFEAEGFEKEFYKRKCFDKEILVPFCPESELSGINYKGFMKCVWYKKAITVPKQWSNKNIILHFGACDYETTVWVNEQKVGVHRGGYSSFEFDITRYIVDGENSIVVAAYDDAKSNLQPSGKQSHKLNSFAAYYTRTTGIWQTVWLEAVDKKHISLIKATPNAFDASVTLEVQFSSDAIGCVLNARASFDKKDVGEAKTIISKSSEFITIKLSEAHLWDIGEGNLYDLVLTLDEDGYQADYVESYFGLRSVYLKDGAFFINGRAVFGRWVLDQGFYPDGIYTAPNDEAFIRDIEYSRSFGFNGARLHEKVFEPRFLYHADKMGYPVWGEQANWGLAHYQADAATNFLPEWIEVLERDYSHPSIIGWCPLNETWDDEKRGTRQDDKVIETIYKATKAMDKTRPVIDTSGNFHVITDIYDVHDYEQDPDLFISYYNKIDTEGIVYDQCERSVKSNGRQKWRGEPIFISEYGGFKWPGDVGDGWGYGNAPKSEEEFFDRYKRITEYMLENENILGFCYTQLYDVEQECNGFMTYDRKYKFDSEKIYKINTKQAAIEKKHNK